MLNKAIIDLKKLKNNALAIKNKLPIGVKFNAVVKADGYGHGATEVANALINIADSFSVVFPKSVNRCDDFISCSRIKNFSFHCGFYAFC